MKTQTTKEKAAVKAVFLLGEAIDGINQSTTANNKTGVHFHSAAELPGAAHQLGKSIISVNRMPASRELEKGDIWSGWICTNEELIDDAGNRYGISEIRAIFYTRQQIQTLTRIVKHLQPAPAQREPVQLCFAFAKALPPRAEQ